MVVPFLVRFQVVGHQLNCGGCHFTSPAVAVAFAIWAPVGMIRFGVVAEVEIDDTVLAEGTVAFQFTLCIFAI